MTWSLKKPLLWLILGSMSIMAINMYVSYTVISRHVKRPVYTGAKHAYMIKGREYYQSLHAEPVKIRASDGIDIAGVFIYRPKAKRTILLCHGYKSTKELMHHFVAILPDENIFAFDFRGHGESGGSITSLGYHEQKDLHAVIAHLQTDPRTKSLPLYGLGLSMGGAVLLNASSEFPAFSGLIIDSTFSNLPEQLFRSFKEKTGLPTFPFLYITKFLFRIFYDVIIDAVIPLNYIELLDMPVLFIHSEDDALIPVEEVYLLHERTKSVKELWVVPSCKHGHICKTFPEDYDRRLHDFFKRVENRK